MDISILTPIAGTPYFNSIGLVTGRKTTIDDGYVDYTNLKLFSKVNLDNESLANSKSLTMIYRIFAK